LAPFKSFRQRAWYHEVEQAGSVVRRATLRIASGKISKVETPAELNPAARPAPVTMNLIGMNFNRFGKRQKKSLGHSKSIAPRP